MAFEDRVLTPHTCTYITSELLLVYLGQMDSIWCALLDDWDSVGTGVKK